ncbi:MAG: prenyltransferase/squalene oxidase repeat-containing protein [Halobacteriota archaeon]
MDIMSVIDRSREYLITKQRQDGSIYGEVEYSIWPSAAYLLLLNYLGVHHGRKMDLIEWIIDHQNEDGSWGVITDKSNGDYQNTLMGLAAVKAYMGRDRAERAREWVQTFSGDKLLTPFTAILLSTKEEDIRIPIPIYLTSVKFGKNLGKLHMIFPKLFSWSIFFYPPSWLGEDIHPSFQIISVLKRKKDKKKLNYFDKMIVNRAEKKLTELQLENGSWSCLALSTMCAIYALHELDHDVGSAPITKGLQFLSNLMGQEGNFNLFRLKVWETSLAVIALTESDMPPGNPIIIAGNFLIRAQTEKGGWSFDFPSNVPDNDDTALSLLALNRIPIEQKSNAVKHGIDYLIRMQNDDGGWGAFDRNQCRKDPGKKPPFELLCLMDPSTADVTGHVLQALKDVGGLDKSSKIIRKAIKWLKNDQIKCGAWWGRWGICYIYGTSRVLHGLKAVGENLHSDYILKAIRWMQEIQNPDGGWGEDIASSRSNEPIFGPSTVEHTSWALLALMDVNIDLRSEVIRRGIDFLLKSQMEDGNFPGVHTADGIDPVKYELYSVIFPLWALSKFQKMIGGS